MIENAPRDPLLEPRFHGAYISRFMERERHDRAKALWLRHLESAPDDMKLLGQRGVVFPRSERELAIFLLEAAQAIDPHNAKWPFELGMHQWPDVRRRIVAFEGGHRSRGIAFLSERMHSPETADRTA